MEITSSMRKRRNEIQKQKNHFRRLLWKIIWYVLLHMATAMIMIPLSLAILNEVAKVRGDIEVGGEYLFMALLWYEIYRLIEWLFR